MKGMKVMEKDARLKTPVRSFTTEPLVPRGGEMKKDE
jgi:hypothetical protein